MTPVATSPDKTRPRPARPQNKTGPCAERAVDGVRSKLRDASFVLTFVDISRIGQGQGGDGLTGPLGRT